MQVGPAHSLTPSSLPGVGGEGPSEAVGKRLPTTSHEPTPIRSAADRSERRPFIDSESASGRWDPPLRPRRQAGASDDSPPPRRSRAGDFSAADAEHLDALGGRLQAGAEAFGADLGVAVFALAPVGGQKGE